MEHKFIYGMITIVIVGIITIVILKMHQTTNVPYS